MSTPRVSKPLVILGAAFLVLFVNGGARYAISLALKPMVDDMGWKRGDLGDAVAIFQVCTALAMYLSGRAIDALSPRVVLCGGLALCGVATLSLSLATQPWHVMVLFGLFYAIGNGVSGVVPVAVMVSRAYPSGAGSAGGVSISGMSVGQFFIIGGLSYALATIGWRQVFVFAGLAHFILLPGLWAAIPGGTGYRAVQRTALPGLAPGEAVRTKTFWLLICIYSMCGFCDFFVTTHVVAFALDSGLDPWMSGNLLALMGVTGLIGVVVSGYWGDRRGPARPAMAAFAARVAAFGLVYADQSPLAAAVFALVFGLTFLMTAPLTVLFARNAFGLAHVGAIAGIITMAHHIFGGLGAWFGAAVFDRTGHYDGAFAVSCVGSLIALVLTAMLDERDKQV